MKPKIFVVSGGFAPVHQGHVRMFRDARTHSDRLIVGLNSDAWLRRKTGGVFQTFDTRREIIESIKWVDSVMGFDDDDGTANDLICQVHDKYRRTSDIYFANGGDRRAGVNVPEEALCKELGVHIVCGIGGSDKPNSSSWMLKDWVDSTVKPVVKRRWGHYTVLHETAVSITKELVITPGQSISLQYHNHRSELWTILEGVGELLLSGTRQEISAGQVVCIRPRQNHKVTNIGEADLHIIEVQYGQCDENDIVRLEEIEEPRGNKCTTA